MLFKQYIMEGRPFYDAQGNKYVASRNDHYSKNGEEISKEDYERALEQIRGKPKTNNISKSSNISKVSHSSNIPKQEITQKPIIKKEKVFEPYDGKENGAVYIRRILPNAIIDYSSLKRQNQLDEIATVMSDVYSKYPKVYEHLKNGIFGDANAITKHQDEIETRIKENLKDKEIFEDCVDLSRQGIELTIDKFLKKYRHLHFSELIKLYISPEETEKFIKKYQLTDIYDLHQNEEALKELATRHLPDMIKKPVTLPSTGTLAYYSKTKIPSKRGIIVNKNRANDDVLGINDVDDSFYDDFVVKDLRTPMKVVMAHEFGHVLDDVYNLRENKEIIKLFRSNKRWLEKDLSKYGSKDICEFIAECFCEYHLSRNPRQIPQEFGKILEKIVGEK